MDVFRPFHRGRSGLLFFLLPGSISALLERSSPPRSKEHHDPPSLFFPLEGETGLKAPVFVRTCPPPPFPAGRAFFWSPPASLSPGYKDVNLRKHPPPRGMVKRRTFFCLPKGLRTPLFSPPPKKMDAVPCFQVPPPPSVLVKRSSLQRDRPLFPP